MTNNGNLMEQAKQLAREEFSRDQTFQKLDRSQQFELYRDRVNDIHNQLAQQQTVSDAMSADQLVNKKFLQNQRIDQEGEQAGRVLRDVNFPKFVKDLLKGVFDANLTVMKEQMESYVDLVEKITKPASEFIKTIDDVAAYTFMAESQPNRFQLLPPKAPSNLPGGTPPGVGSVPQLSTSSGTQLADKDGNPLSKDDIRGEVMQAKLQLANQHQQLLEEMLLMGVTRLVVDHGKVKASVDFQIKAHEALNASDSAYENKQHSQTKGFHLGYSPFFRGPSFGISHSKTNTQIQISTAGATGTGTTDETTKVHGEVEINFKSDYFKLDNFRDILAQTKPKTDQKDKTQPVDQSES